MLPGLTLLINILRLYKSENENPNLEQLAVLLAENLIKESRSKTYFKSELLAASFIEPRFKKFRFGSDQNERNKYHSTAKNI